ncbi:hypothetical protein COOONC_27546 [Cooperia oncophora]
MQTFFFVEIFVQSLVVRELVQLTLNDRDIKVESTQDSGEIDVAGEVDDLESSLLKISLICNKENQSEDSFDEPPSFKSIIINKSPTVLRTKNFSSVKGGYFLIGIEVT